MEKIPTNLVPLIDGDILRYEIGFASETGWRAITEEQETIPPFSYVEGLLLDRLEAICRNATGFFGPYRIFLTEGKTFRYDLAKTKEYKGTRIEKKPWHYKNLSVYMYDVLGAEIVTGIEADDRMAIEQVSSNGNTIICSRDKDLRQVPGYFYSWELGRQPSFGPICIDRTGDIALSEDRKKINATGLYCFYAQVLMGDKVDNIPGLPGCGPVAAYDWLTDIEDGDALYNSVAEAYINTYRDEPEPEGMHLSMTPWECKLLEQGRLCWMTRSLNADGSPVLWELGMEE